MALSAGRHLKPFPPRGLVTAGGWDPYNVTEDADLGLRLARFGFSSGALDSATYEEAPVTWKVWYAQRARWYKGWLQTVLVHMRDPSMLWRDMSPRRAVPIAFLIGGSLLTLALHPIFCMILMGYLIGLWNMPVPDGLMSDITVCLSALAAISGYGAAVIAGRSAARARGFDPRFSDLALIPAYWLCASFAFYRAVWDFFIRPHHWHKTTHGTARKRKTPDFGKKGEDRSG
ncbi:glycosyltransferase [Pannonibacter sp. Pt2-lr]